MTEHSEHFEQVKYWYDNGFWSDIRVRNAVTKGWITAAEYTEITGKYY